MTSFQEMKKYHPHASSVEVEKWVSFCVCGHQEYQHGAAADLVDCLVCNCKRYDREPSILGGDK